MLRHCPKKRPFHAEQKKPWIFHKTNCIWWQCEWLTDSRIWRYNNSAPYLRRSLKLSCQWDTTKTPGFTCCAEHYMQRQLRLMSHVEAKLFGYFPSLLQPCEVFSGFFTRGSTRHRNKHWSASDGCGGPHRFESSVNKVADNNESPNYVTRPQCDDVSRYTTVKLDTMQHGSGSLRCIGPARMCSNMLSDGEIRIQQQLDNSQSFSVQKGLL